jgi:hypothetical protein
MPKKQGIKCYNYSQDGHYQSASTALAHCSVCDKDGHTTGMCRLAVKQPSLQWYGYALDGIGFHCLEVEDLLLEVVHSSKEHEAMVIAGKNHLNPDLLSQDLKALVEGTWDWKVRRLSDTDFAVVFPTKDSLNMCKNLYRNAGGISLPISKVLVLFVDPQPNYRASAQLAKIWVHLDGVPDCLRKKRASFGRNQYAG